MAVDADHSFTRLGRVRRSRPDLTPGTAYLRRASRSVAHRSCGDGFWPELLASARFLDSSCLEFGLGHRDDQAALVLA